MRVSLFFRTSLEERPGFEFVAAVILRIMRGKDAAHGLTRLAGPPFLDLFFWHGRTDFDLKSVFVQANPLLPDTLRSIAAERQPASVCTSLRTGHLSAMIVSTVSPETKSHLSRTVYGW